MPAASISPDPSADALVFDRADSLVARARHRPPSPDDQPEQIVPVDRVPFFLAPEARDPDALEFPEHDFEPGRAALFNSAMVRFFEGGRVVEADAGDMFLRAGELVMCDVDRGLQLATVTAPSTRKLSRLGPPVRVVRRAHDGDQRGEPDRRKREQEATRLCVEHARAQNLPMKVVRTEIGQGGSRVTCYFASEERVDFRELARALGTALHLRVEMRQVGVRDSTKVLGGVGPCGLQLCCSTFLQDFAPVSIRHAKDQGLVLNPTKISGVCGRLMCCLVYEEAYYRAHRKLLPKIGKRVVTPKGEGKVRDVDVLKLTARVEIADREGASRLFEFAASDLKPVAAPPAGEARRPATNPRHAAPGRASEPSGNPPAPGPDSPQEAGSNEEDPDVDEQDAEPDEQEPA
ncbi:MAG: stage 0 sporulation protein [Deltaproteobacteria bacterium]|nr:stage 0 sporulation protein [Deltaproteobacteria bacterium]